MKKLTWLAVFCWVLLVGGTFAWHYSAEKESHQELALQTSRAFFKQLIFEREWNAAHGGVYVPVTDKTKPNPYLQDPLRDLQTNEGISLTKINPAFMTRQIAGIAALNSGIKFHITSLKPIRPANKPTERERSWLQEFEQGVQERGMFVRQESGDIFYYMAPLITTKNCLKCHAKQGYKEGDIRGGISITLPFSPTANMGPLFWGYGLAAAIGVVFILISASLLRKKQQKLLAVNKSLEVEIRQRKTAESGWTAAMDVYDDVLYLLDLNRCLVRANKTFYLMTHSTPETAVGKHIVDIVHPLGEEFPCPVCRAQEEKRDAVIILEKDHPDNPAGHPLEIIVKIIRDEQGLSSGIFMSLHDLSASRKEVEEKQNLEKQLRHASKMEAIGTLAGGIAHDFNNLLAIILGYTEMAKEDAPGGSSLANDLEKISVAGNRAKDLVRQILTFSRQAEVERIPVQLQLLVKEALKIIRSTIPTTIKIHDDIDSECGFVLVDPTQTHQILMNLCANANHAMEGTGGTLKVELQNVCIDEQDDKQLALHVEPGEYVELLVSDTGSGIGSDIIEKIFEPFFTTKDVDKGTGMGLAIVHGIVADFGGAITVESKLGKGTIFRVYFPVVEKDALKPKKDAGEISLGKERILFIDDEQLLAEMGQAMLERLGYNVTMRQSSLEALSIFENCPEEFDLIITDQTMPDITGLDLARRVLQIRPDMPVILCTGYSNLVDEETAKAMGIKEFAMKPLNKSQVSQLIRKVLDGAK